MSEHPGDRLVAGSRPHRPARPEPGAAAGVRRQVVGLLVWAVRTASRLAALVLTLYALFTVFGANPDNVWHRFVEGLAGLLSLGFEGLFQLADPRWEALVDYGLAAFVWLVLGSAVASLVRRAAP
jgi:hypothetical protein